MCQIWCKHVKKKGKSERGADWKMDLFGEGLSEESEWVKRGLFIGNETLKGEMWVNHIRLMIHCEGGYER